MCTLFDDLQSIGALSFFQEAGLPLDILLPGNLDWEAVQQSNNPYRKHRWIVMQRAGKAVSVNAVPTDSSIDTDIWEEWYTDDSGRVIHHILTTSEPERYDEIFTAPDHDEIHPPPVMGRRWYVVEDPDLSMLLLRKQ